MAKGHEGPEWPVHHCETQVSEIWRNSSSQDLGEFEGQGKRLEAEWSERVQVALQEQAQLLSQQKKAMRSREAELTAALDDMNEKLRRETTKALRLESELRAIALAM